MPDPTNPANDGIADALKQMAEGQKAMMTLIAQQGQMFTGITKMMTDMSQTFAKGINLNQPPPPPTPPDFSKMDAGSITKFMLDEVKKMTEEVREGVKKDLDKLKYDIARGEQSDELDKVRSQKGNEDFNEWLPEMKKLLENNPNLSVQQLLNLARSENPTKASEMREKYKPKDEANGVVFGGLTPTSDPGGFSGGRMPERKDPSKRMSIRDGIDKAMAEVWPSGAPLEDTL